MLVMRIHTPYTHLVDEPRLGVIGRLEHPQPHKAANTPGRSKRRQEKGAHLIHCSQRIYHPIMLCRVDPYLQLPLMYCKTSTTILNQRFGHLVRKRPRCNSHQIDLWEPGYPKDLLSNFFEIHILTGYYLVFAL